MGLSTKEDIVKSWLPRYTGTEINEFGKYILLTKFQTMLNAFPKSLALQLRAKQGLCKHVLMRILPL